MTKTCSRLLLVALATLAACTSTGEPGSGGPADAAPAPELPWTTRFAQPAVLLAREIRIEGPPGLFDHVAVRQDQRLTPGADGVPGSTADAAEYSLETTPQGLLQVVEVREGAPPLVEIRGQLDGWTLVALHKLVVLERPLETPVRVSAAGQAWFSSRAPGADPGAPAAGSEGERRGERLEFVGERPE